MRSSTERRRRVFVLKPHVQRSATWGVGKVGVGGFVEAYCDQVDGGATSGIYEAIIGVILRSPPHVALRCTWGFSTTTRLRRSVK